MNQYTLQFLRRMASNSLSSLLCLTFIVAPALPREDVLKLLIAHCKLLHLNELEIVAWSLLAETQSWALEAGKPNLLLLLAAFQAKVQLDARFAVGTAHS